MTEDQQKRLDIYKQIMELLAKDEAKVKEDGQPDGHFFTYTLSDDDEPAPEGDIMTDTVGRYSGNKQFMIDTFTVVASRDDRVRCAILLAAAEIAETAGYKDTSASIKHFEKLTNKCSCAKCILYKLTAQQKFNQS